MLSAEADNSTAKADHWSRSQSV